MEIGTQEAARRLKITAGRVRHFIDDGRLIARKVGNTWLIKDTDLARFVLIKRLKGRPKTRGRTRSGNGGK